jgi:hypothetical protein
MNTEKSQDRVLQHPRANRVVPHKLSAWRRTSSLHMAARAEHMTTQDRPSDGRLPTNKLPAAGRCFAQPLAVWNSATT